MVRDGAWKMVLGAWLVGGGLTLVLHGVQFGPPGAGWWFGLGAGAWEGALGLVMNRKALQGRDERDAAKALGGGMARMLILLAVWWLGRGRLWPELASAWCLVTMYVVMMIAGVAQVARNLQNMNRS
jgi:hypothetical protein